MDFSLAHEVAPDTVMVLTLVALLAGGVDAMAGGGGLLTIPALLWVGLSPQQALATNKLQAVVGALGALLKYRQAGLVQLRGMYLPFMMALGGGAIGSWTVNQCDPGRLAALLPLLLIGVSLYWWWFPRIAEVAMRRRLGIVAFAGSAALGIGFYDGFFGPGTGTWFALALVTLLGFQLIQATAHAKLLNFASNFGALLVFVASGPMLWTLGLSMALGQGLGSWLGAQLALRHGEKLIRALLMLVSLTLALRLGWQTWW